MKQLFRTALACLFAVPLWVTAQNNPVLPGFHADPEIVFAPETGRYYIYSTTDGQPGWGGWEYAAYSSEDLKSWRGEGTVLDAQGPQVAWSDGSLWAPAIERVVKKGKPLYYLYFSANHPVLRRKVIGVAVSKSPTGPFKDLGHPIVTDSPAGHGQQIDVDVFTDPVSGKHYLYWGNGYMAGAELNEDMTSLKAHTTQVLTPAGGSLKDYQYREAPYVFFRKGIYYFLWSVDDTGSANYHVAYGTATSPLGPITVAKEPVVIVQRPEQEIYGTGHNSVINIPGTDEWRIVYHRINKDFLKHRGGWHREVCIDRITFREDGTIEPVVPTK